LGSYQSPSPQLSGLGNAYSTQAALNIYLPGAYLGGTPYIGSFQNNPLTGNFVNYSQSAFKMPYQAITSGGFDMGSLFRGYSAPFSLRWGPGHYPLVWLSSYGYN